MSTDQTKANSSAARRRSGQRFHRESCVLKSCLLDDCGLRTVSETCPLGEDPGFRDRTAAFQVFRDRAPGSHASQVSTKADVEEANPCPNLRRVALDTRPARAAPSRPALALQLQEMRLEAQLRERPERRGRVRVDDRNERLER